MIKKFKTYYRKIFKGEIFVIKVGGRVITDEKARKSLITNIDELVKDGIRVLLIYGGGEAIDEALKKEGLNPKKVNGRRITSEKDIKVIKRVVAADIGMLISETIAAQKMSGYSFGNLPTRWATLKRRPKKDGMPRFDGAPETVNAKLIRDVFQEIPFVCCPSLGQLSDGTTVNINADTLAVALASNIKAAKLILLTDVDGVMIDGKLRSVVRRSEISELIKSGAVTGGMQVKLESCSDALLAGVKRVHIINGFTKDAIKTEVYTKTGLGTMIVRKAEKRKYEKETK